MTSTTHDEAIPTTFYRPDPFQMMLEGICAAIHGEVHVRAARLADLIRAADASMSKQDRIDEMGRLGRLNETAQRLRYDYMQAVEYGSPTNDVVEELFAIASELLGHYFPKGGAA